MEQPLEPGPLSYDDVSKQLDTLRQRLESIGLLDSQTPASIRNAREASPLPVNPLSGFAPMVRSVPQPDR
jgi:hypothetical protein